MPEALVDEKTKGLLLKLRKGATSGFGTTHWATALAAVGFELKVVEKERREVLAVAITAPNGEQLRVEKNPGYRHIVYYGIGEAGTTPVRWAKEQGFDLTELASKALGMDSPGDERARKDYYVRDWTHTGTCGVCGSNVKMKGTVESGRTGLVHHGYERPGTGEIEGDCFGVNYPPHELSPTCAKDWLEKVVRERLGIARRCLLKLKSGETKRLVDMPRSRHQEARVYLEGEPGWEERLLSEIASVEYRITSYVQMEKEFMRKVAEWKVDDLPEVKLARKFGAKPAP